MAKEGTGVNTEAEMNQSADTGRAAKLARMRELTDLLNRAAKAYYADAAEIMTNYEYDRDYDELTGLEKELGTTFADSPTVHVGYEAVSELPKERHEAPMLSLDKTKDVSVLAAWLGNQEGLLSWKMDGLTVVLTYRDGALQKAVTRGNGEIGEVITNNAKVFKNVPLTIPCQDELILRGEALIRYSDFERINETIPEAEAHYKNPRNLCSGSVRQLNNRITAERSVYCNIFTLVRGRKFVKREEELNWVASLGFTVVHFEAVTAETLPQKVKDFEAAIPSNDFPSDGLVLTYNDIAYGLSLGQTAKFPRNSIAFKWQDEIRETVLRKVEWSASRTGLINPIAVFDPVELEGTTVSRASLHNISIMEELELGVGDTVTVYKANMIIPQIAENLTKSGVRDIPETCPVCGAPTRIRDENGTRTLVCDNPECTAKKIKSFDNFVSRNAMNLEGMSEATLEKFIASGFIHEFADLFLLQRFRDQIVEMDGFGEKSYENLTEAAKRAAVTTPERLLAGLGIPNVGAAGARELVRAFGGDFQAVRNASVEELTAVEGVGEVTAESIAAFFADPANAAMIDHLLAVVSFAPREEQTRAQTLAGRVFVITGSLEHYPNRDALKAEILSLGGKVTGSVTKKTDYLINNDALSGSTKNRTAKQLGVQIITEDEYRNTVRGGT